MSDNSNNKSTWVSIALVALVFAGYRTITGHSLTHDLASKVSGSMQAGRPANQNRSQTTSTPNELPPAQSIDPVADQKTNSGLSDLQEQAIGFLAQAICSARLYGYTKEQVSEKMDYFIEAKQAQSSLRDWMMEPKVANVAAKLSMSSNQNCTGFDLQSSDAKDAFIMMEGL